MSVDLEQIILPLRQRLLRLAKYLPGRTADIDKEDIVHEQIVKLLSEMESIQRQVETLPGDSVLYGQLRNTLRSLQRRALSRFVDLEHAAGNTSEIGDLGRAVDHIAESRWQYAADGFHREQESAAVIREHYVRLAQAVRTLPPRLRTVLELSRFGRASETANDLFEYPSGLSIREIADELKISPDTVVYRLRQARKMICAKLRLSGVEGSVKDQSGAGLPGAEVLLRSQDRPFSLVTRTGPHGGFRFEEFPAGGCVLQVRLGGRIVAQRKITTKAGVARLSDIVVSLSQGGADSGRV